MGVETLIPLLLLVLIPGIILLYVLKQKGKDVSVSSTLLWKETIKNARANKPWEKFKNNILMYLQILTVLFLIFALMGPYLKNGGHSDANVILVFDNSASMKAMYNKDTSRFDEAKRQAREYIDGLNDNAKVTIITSSDNGHIEITNVSDKRKLNSVIDKLECTNYTADALECVNMLNSFAKQMENSKVFVFTDAAYEDNSDKTTVINLNTGGENSAVNYINYSENADGSLTVLVKLTNYSDKPVSKEVNLYGEDKLLSIQKTELEPNSSAVVFFENVSFLGSYLKAEINEKDILNEDNISYVTVNTKSTKRVLLISPGNTFLENAVSLTKGIELFKTVDLQINDKSDKFDLYIFDSVDIKALPEIGNAVIINPQISDVTKSLNTKQGVRLTMTDNELTDYVSGTKFGVNYAKEFEKPEWAQSLLENDGGCYGYYGEDGLRRIVVLGFDIHETDFALSAEFPLFISNIMDYTLSGEMLSKNGFVAGDKVNLFGRNHDADIIVKSPSKEETIISPQTSTKVYENTSECGVYEVSQEAGENKKAEYFAVNFPVDEESDEPTGQNVAVSSDKLTTGGIREIRSIIIAGLLFLLMAEWFVYVKRS